MLNEHTKNEINGKDTLKYIKRTLYNESLITATLILSLVRFVVIWSVFGKRELGRNLLNKTDYEGLETSMLEAVFKPTENSTKWKCSTTI